MDVEKSSNSYNLNFSVTGEYINISQLISDLENNSDLNFRISDFKISGSGDKLSSSFKVKDVNIDSSTIVSTKSTNSSKDESSNTKTKNSTSTGKNETSSSDNTATKNSTNADNTTN